MIGLRGLDGWISYWLWERQEGGLSQGRMDFWLNSEVILIHDIINLGRVI